MALKKTVGPCEYCGKFSKSLKKARMTVNGRFFWLCEDKCEKAMWGKLVREGVIK